VEKLALFMIMLNLDTTWIGFKGGNIKICDKSERRRRQWRGRTIYERQLRE